MINEIEKQFKANVLEDIVTALKTHNTLLIKTIY